MGSEKFVVLMFAVPHLWQRLRVQNEVALPVGARGLDRGCAGVVYILEYCEPSIAVRTLFYIATFATSTFLIK